MNGLLDGALESLLRQIGSDVLAEGLSCVSIRSDDG